MNNATKSNVFATANGGGNIKTGERASSGNSSQRSHCPVQRGAGGAFFSRRIGATTYRVGISFNPASAETLQEKILRMVKNDLNFAPLRATMELPQTGGSLERGSL